MFVAYYLKHQQYCFDVHLSRFLDTFLAVDFASVIIQSDEIQQRSSSRFHTGPLIVKCETSVANLSANCNQKKLEQVKDLFSDLKNAIDHDNVVLFKKLVYF